MNTYEEIVYGSIYPNNISVLFTNQEYVTYMCEHITTNTENNFKTITLPLKFLIKGKNNSIIEHSLVHPLAQMYILSFWLKQQYKFNNYFELNTIYSINKLCNIESIGNNSIQWNNICDLLHANSPMGLKILSECQPYFKYENNKILEKSLLKAERKFSMFANIQYNEYKNHLYTHSLDWAYLGNRELAKKYLNYKKRFSSQIDTLMQKTNYNETNGIINGSNFSDLVGEIVLTRIDRLLYDDLKQRNISFKNDYEIIRDSDNIYIFANSHELMQQIKDLYLQYARFYRLNISDDCIDKTSKPFIVSNLWNHDIDLYLNEFYDKFWKQLNLTNNESIQDLFQRLLHKVKETLILNPNEHNICTYILQHFLNLTIQHIQENKSTEKLPENLFELSKIKEYYNLLFDICSLDLINNNVNLMISNIEFSNYYFTKILFSSFKIENDIDDLTYSIYSQILQYNLHSWTETRNVFIAASYCKKNLTQDLLLQYTNRANDDIDLLIIMYYIHKKKLHFTYNKLLNKFYVYYNSLLDKLDTYFDLNSKDIKTLPTINTDNKYNDLLGRIELVILMSINQINIINQPLKDRFSYYQQLINLINKLPQIEALFLQYIMQHNASLVNWSISKNQFLIEIIRPYLI